ncbi:MAG: methyltransferase domain-containing protein [Patescibacteria group bacterium]
MVFSSSMLLDARCILREAHLREGFVVADFGCGPGGHFVFPAATAVGPKGRVYAVDIQKQVITSIRSYASLNGFTNIEPLWGDIERIGGVRVTDASLDTILLVNNFYLVKNRELLVKEIKRTLKSDGALVVVDWLTSKTPIGPPIDQRVGKELVGDLFTRFGFQLDHSFKAGQYHWGLVFRK